MSDKREDYIAERRKGLIEAMSRPEWRKMYREWRKPFAHLPSSVRGNAVRGCAGKVGYEVKADAQAIADGLPPRPGKRCSVYPCCICKKFHIGNTTYPEGHSVYRIVT